MSHRLENLEISKVTVAAAARFTFFYYRRGAAAADVQPRWTSLLSYINSLSKVNIAYDLIKFLINTH
jgi:hypothetical protein